MLDTVNLTTEKTCIRACCVTTKIFKVKINELLNIVEQAGETTVILEFDAVIWKCQTFFDIPAVEDTKAFFLTRF